MTIKERRNISFRRFFDIFGIIDKIKENYKQRIFKKIPLYWIDNMYNKKTLAPDFDTYFIWNLQT